MRDQAKMLGKVGSMPWQRCRTALKAGATRLLTRLPVSDILRRRQTADGGISVLVYHTLGPDGEDFDAWTVLEETAFRAQIEMLRAHYEIVGLDEALQGLGTQSEKPRAVLTFDDGECGLHRHLLPIVEELRIPVTIYFATEQIETQEPYWFDVLMNALQTTEPHVIDLSEFGLPPVTVGATRGVQNWLAISEILEHLKLLAPDERTSAVDEALRQAPNGARPAFTPMKPLTKEQLSDLARNDLITIGSHTHCHSLLDRIPLSEAEASVRKSMSLLREWTGRDIKHFAYPNGNYTPALEQTLAGIGLSSATIGENRLWRAEDSLFAIPRVFVGRYDTPERLELRLVGI